LQLDGFESTTTYITITQTNPDPIMLKLQAEPLEKYSLKISSEPAGAHVWLNGYETAQITPADLSALAAGKEQTIKLTLDGYNDYEETLNGEGGESKSINAKLDPVKKATLMVQSEPSGASILINNVDSDKLTPDAFEGMDFPAKVHVQLRKTGYKEIAEDVSLNSAKAVLFAPTLIKDITPVKVSISANIKGADVYIDDKIMLTTPGHFDLMPGKYTVVLKKSDYKTVSEVIKISDTETQERKLYFKLNKEMPVKPAATNTPVEVTRPVDAYSAFQTLDSNQSQLAKLRIDSRPSGASVVINGQPRGVTPIMVSDLKKNVSLTVRVTKTGYQSWSRTMSLNKDRTEISANLQSK